ncbi:MAG: AcrR family transcriptional regulator [Chlamydiales bacterium]|jgi:AcrR family transcriptional regulator
MPTDSPIPPWAPARQARSRRTAERIVAAALDLLGERPFERMSVAEIAAGARISVGGFYARFSSKDALLDYLNHTVIDGMVDLVQEQFSPAATTDLGARDVIGRYIQLAVATFREHRTVLRAVSLRSRTSADPAFRERVRQANRSMHDIFRARLREREDEFGHGDPALAVDLALTAVSGAMREYVLFADQRPQFDPVDDERLATELTDLFCNYLGIR